MKLRLQHASSMDCQHQPLTLQSTESILQTGDDIASLLQTLRQLLTDSRWQLTEAEAQQQLEHVLSAVGHSLMSSKSALTMHAAPKSKHHDIEI